MDQTKSRDQQLLDLEQQILDTLGEKNVATITPQEQRAIGAVIQILVPEKDPHLARDRRIALLQDTLLKQVISPDEKLGSAVLMALYMHAFSIREGAAKGRPTHESAEAVCEMLNTLIGVSQVDVIQGDVNQERHWELHTAHHYMLARVPGLQDRIISEVQPPALSQKDKILENFGALAQRVSAATTKGI